MLGRTDTALSAVDNLAKLRPLEDEEGGLRLADSRLVFHIAEMGTREC